MNYHFLSFLLDVASWMIASYLWAVFIIKLEKVARKKHFLLKIFCILAGVVGGMYATLSHALPNVGFSMYHFLLSMVYTLFVPVLYLPHLQKRYLRKLNDFFARGGELYGNSH